MSTQCTTENESYLAIGIFLGAGAGAICSCGLSAQISAGCCSGELDERAIVG
jgi:hypothetical protein